MTLSRKISTRCKKYIFLNTKYIYILNLILKLFIEKVFKLFFIVKTDISLKITPS